MYIIERPLAQAILDYLVRQPYGEVRQLVEGLEALRPVQVGESGTLEDVEEPSLAEKPEAT